jgi:poly-beta-hydroxyalkanoate depolymerase
MCHQTSFAIMIKMKAKPPFTDLYIYLLLGLCGYMTADLGILYFRDQMIPNTPPPKAPLNRKLNPNMFDNSNFMAITQKIFLIPMEKFLMRLGQMELINKKMHHQF